MIKVSKNQQSFKEKLITKISPFGYSVISEDQDRTRLTIKLQDGITHVPDFYIPEINLFIELSGQNFLYKILKMKYSHQIKGINYFAIPEIWNKLIKTKDQDEQLEELVLMLQSEKTGEEITKISEQNLDNIYKLFIELYNKHM